MASSEYSRDVDYIQEVKKVFDASCIYGSDEIFEEIYISSPYSRDISVLERFGKLDIFQRPLCLVFTDDDMNLHIDESVLHQISRIDVPVSVVGVCGVYRTGKSYLMNRLAREKLGFSLGSTIRSETKGIWAWCQPHPKVKDQVLVLLDTEGLCDAAKNNHDHDVKIFCLTMLMSSCLIYNMKGVIDKDALERLSIVADVTKKVCVSGNEFAKEEENHNSLQIISPFFVLCLRDFHYDLFDESEMTADEYMESCFEDSSEMNNVKQNIKTFFPRRRCFVISQPAMNKRLKRLETLSERELDPDFIEDVEKMIDFIHSLGPKCLDEVTKKSWDGNAFESFLRSYIIELSKGQRMEFGHAMESASRYHNSKLKVDICRKYEAQLDGLKIPEPSKLILLGHAMTIMHNLLREFRQKAYPFLVEKFEDKTMESMKSKMDELVVRNSDKVKKLCFDYLSSHHNKMLKVNAEKYDNKNGVSLYENDLDGILQKYKEEFNSYDMAERFEALQTFRDGAVVHKTKVVYQAKLKQEIEKFEERQTNDQIDTKAYIKQEMEKLRKEEKKKMQAELDSYKKRVDEFAAGSVGFFKRLKFAFTGSLDP